MNILFSILILLTSSSGKLDVLNTKTVDKNQIYCACNRSSDSLILRELYLATNGANWTLPWNLSDPINKWSGIVLTPSGCVQSINLSYNNMNGSLPFDIGNLSGLKFLSLFGNKLTGPLPIGIGNLSSLEELTLEDNNFTGKIPTEIGNLSNLKFLNIAKNAFTGSIPTTIGNLTNLINVNLSFNQLNGSIPTSISQLTKMNILDLSHNELTGVVPSSIGLLTGLKEIYLNHNKLGGELPANFSNLTLLNNVWLSDNEFIGLVPDMRLAPLNALRIENNSFDQIPDYSTVTTWGNQLPFGLVIFGNKFTFNDLIPLSKIHRRFYYSFSPQDPIQLDSIIYIPVRSNYIVSTGVDPGLSDNNFKWFKDTSIVYISNRNTYELINVTEAEEGYYSGRVTNPLILNFELEIAKFRVVVFDPNKCDLPEASKNCFLAPEFCSTKEINSYCGTLTQPDTTTQVYLCDSSELTSNARWLSFRAPSDSIVLEIFPLSCTGVDSGGVQYTGMQAAIWSSCSAGSDSLMVCQSQCETQPFQIGGKYFQQGAIYKLLLNGCKGDVCNFIIKVAAGKKNFNLDEPGSITGDQSFCQDTLDHIFSISKIQGANYYHWYINDTFYQSTLDSFVNLKNFNSGIYQLKVKASNVCDTTNTSFVLFRITPKLLLQNVVYQKINVDSAFQIVFKIEGGIPPYSIQKGKGRIDSTTSFFYSDTFLCKSAFDIEIIDTRGCFVSLTGIENCGCKSQAGAMPSDTLKVCEPQSFTAKFTGTEIRDTSDIAAYILFSDPSNPVGSIIKTSTNGLFPFDPSKFKFDIPHYLARVVGRPNEKREIKFNHPCISYSNFQVVIFRKRPLISAGPDLTFCGMEGNLNCFGNHTSGIWKVLSGPGKVIIENPAGDFTKIRVDTFGVYNFVREVNNGYCAHKDEVKVSFVESFKPEINGFLFVCDGQNTNLDAGEYSRFIWSTGDTNRILRVQSPGTYCVTVTDNGNCTGSNCVAVSISNAPFPVLRGPDTICTGDQKFIQVTQNFLRYDWNTMDSSAILPIDSGGLYCVTVTANNGCKGTDCVYVTPKSRSYSMRFDTVCHGESFTLHNQTFDKPGLHDVILEEASINGCDSVIQVHLSWLPQIIILDTTIIKDDGTNSGAISVVIGGGKSPFRYLWSNGSKSSIITNLKAGKYSLIVTDANNCKATFIIQVPSLTKTQGTKIIQPEFVIYPNPIQSRFSCLIQNNTDETNLKLYLYNSQGELVHYEPWITKGHNDVHSLELDLVSGIYLLKIVHPGKNYYAYKIIFNK